MSRPKKTTAQLESTREKILDTALSILQEAGPEAVTSRAIAEKLGVAHMSLFTYFENHAAILRALREREMSKWQAQQQGFEQRATSENIVQVVEDILRHYVDFARENPNLYRLAWVMPETGMESPEENRQRMQSTIGHLAGLLQLGMDSGSFELREPFLTASTALAMMNAPFILFHSGKLVNLTLRDRMADEVFSAVTLYLKKK
jgi:AcrR family transcriptional regulator